MAKRVLAVLTTAVLSAAGLALAGGSAAMAQTDPPKRAAVQACRQAAAPTKDRESFQACLAKAGVTGRPGRPAKGPGHGPAMARRAVHGEFTVKGKDGTFQTLTFDRGTVATATTANRIVLTRPDGPTVSFELTADTRYKGIANAAAIEKGKPAYVVSKAGKAVLVAQHKAGNKAPRPVVPKP
ncbi:MAG: hypothetical protein ACRDZW_06745 [Acidimicrobiales bacterium]